MHPWPGAQYRAYCLSALFLLRGIRRAAPAQVTACRVVTEVYLPEIKPIRPSDWRLLIINKHSTYNIEEFMYHCRLNRVFILYLPSHSSHKSQPLDRSIFSPLKNYFRQNTKALTHYKASSPANKQRFLLYYRDASK